MIIKEVEKMKITLIIIGSILLIITTVFAYYGGFKKITPVIKICGGETIAFEKVKGDYKQSGIVSDRVYYSLLNKHKIDTYKGFGIYFDDPGTVETENLRSHVGCIIENKDLDKLDEIKNDFEVEQYPEKEYIVAEFPYKGKLSVIFGLFKAYPALKAFTEKNGYSTETQTMEIWDIPNKKTIYRKEIL